MNETKGSALLIAQRMDADERAQEIANDPKRNRGRHDGTGNAGEVGPFDVFEHQARALFVARDFVDTDHVGVTDAR